MKKIISMALVLIMLVCSVTTLTACGIPSDFNDAKANLKDNDYKVTTSTKSDDIELMLALFGIEDAEVEAIIDADKDEDAIMLVYCEDTDTAEAVEEKLAEFLEEYAEYFDDYEGLEVGRDGKIVYMATEQALKDVK